ncbi:MAG: TlpA disulfide reductase family protein [Brumimicrobium sp.]
MKNYIFLLLFSTLLFSCGEEKRSSKTQRDSKEKTENKEDSSSQWMKDPDLEPNVTITGNIKNGPKVPLIIEANTDKGAVVIAKGNSDEEGNFSIQGAIKDMGLYQMRIEENVPKGQEPRVIPMTLAPNDSVFIQTNFNDFNQSVVYSGTEWAEAVNGYMKELKKFIDWQKSVKNPEQYSQEKISKMVMDNKQSMDDYIIETIEDNPSNPANILLMTNLMPMMGYENYDKSHLKVLQNMHRAFEEKYPDHPMTKNIGAQVAQVEKGFDDYEAFSKNNIAPEISMPNKSGEMKKLSDLKGNYVLIDFWASWCKPCRQENPNVVRLYNKYKEENFTIFSVSLDEDKDRWLKAIKADNLIWDHHVSDLKGWKSEVVSTYQFNGIPHTVLIDPEGKIIGTKLRGASLEQKLKEIFGK